MSMSDYVTINCAKCGEMTEFQSKAGRCELNRYNIFEAPDIIKSEFAGEYFICDHCAARNKVVVQTIVNVITV